MQDTDEPTDLTIRTVDPDGDEGRAWFTAAHLAFGEGVPDDTMLAIERRQARQLDQTLYGVWPATSWSPGAPPVATYSSWTGSINVGGGRTQPLHMISDVTVAPTHRRRGLLRRMMTADLARAAEGGFALAALTATEGAIYGRFGFGPATRLTRTELDTARFALREPLPADPGRLELVAAAEAWPAVSANAERHLATTRGAVERPPSYEDVLTGAYRPRDRGPDPQLRAVLHLDADGAPDGHAVFRVEPNSEPVRMEVVDLLGHSRETELRLWSLLASTDLVARVTYDDQRVDSPLPWSLRDPRAVRATATTDLLWVRVLDLPAALKARPWAADDSVALAVHDPLGHVEGTWRVETSGGAASVSATDEVDRPDVALDADTLGSLLLGDTRVATLADAGRLDGTPEAVDRLAAMADLGPPPYCATAF